jgi:hypothetical protein
LSCSTSYVLVGSMISMLYALFGYLVAMGLGTGRAGVPSEVIVVVHPVVVALQKRRRKDALWRKSMAVVRIMIITGGSLSKSPSRSVSSSSSLKSNHSRHLVITTTTILIRSFTTSPATTTFPLAPHREVSGGYEHLLGARQVPGHEGGPRDYRRLRLRIWGHQAEP